METVGKVYDLNRRRVVKQMEERGYTEAALIEVVPGGIRLTVAGVFMDEHLVKAFTDALIEAVEET